MDRTLALALLRAVLERNTTLDDALAKLPPAEPRDRASAHRMAACVLRRLGTLDAVIEPFLRRAPPPVVRLILALGAAQLLFLQTPAHAAVATSVDLTREAGFAAHAGLVNAVLRKVNGEGAEILASLDLPRLDTPLWLWAAWGERARAIAEAQSEEAPIDLTLKNAEVVAPEGGELLPNGSWRYPAGTRVMELGGFESGDFWVQDEAATLPARLLAAQPGETIADLCAAPGGKTAQLVAAGARVTAVERDPKRVVRLRENLARLGMEAEIVTADAAIWKPAGLLDAVLLDAPCSATGTIRRHPDVAHLKKAQDIPALVAMQGRLIAAAAGMLRPGGRMIYAVCSLQPEEGEGHIRDAEAAGLVFSAFSEAELAFDARTRHPLGWLRTDPAMGMDGFFAARFVKAG